MNKMLGITGLLILLEFIGGDGCCRNWRAEGIDSACLSGGIHTFESLKNLRNGVDGYMGYHTGIWEQKKQFVQVVSPCLSVFQSCVLVKFADKTFFGGCFPDDEHKAVSFDVTVDKNDKPVYDFLSGMKHFPVGNRFRLGLTCDEIYRRQKSSRSSSLLDGRTTCVKAPTLVNGIPQLAEICCCKTRLCTEKLLDFDKQSFIDPYVVKETKNHATNQLIHWTVDDGFEDGVLDGFEQFSDKEEKSEILATTRKNNVISKNLEIIADAAVSDAAILPTTITIASSVITTTIIPPTTVITTLSTPESTQLVSQLPETEPTDVSHPQDILTTQESIPDEIVFVYLTTGKVIYTSGVIYGIICAHWTFLTITKIIECVEDRRVRQGDYR